MDYRLTGHIIFDPNQYHEDPYFGDPSSELDHRWNDRLRCMKASSTTRAQILMIFKTLRYAFPPRSSRITTRAVSS